MALAVGTRLVYSDDLAEALAELAQPEAEAAVQTTGTPAPTARAVFTRD